MFLGRGTTTLTRSGDVGTDAGAGADRLTSTAGTGGATATFAARCLETNPARTPARNAFRLICSKEEGKTWQISKLPDEGGWGRNRPDSAPLFMHCMRPPHHRSSHILHSAPVPSSSAETVHANKTHIARSIHVERCTIPAPFCVHIPAIHCKWSLFLCVLCWTV
jgi:hypothetical protein